MSAARPAPLPCPFGYVETPRRGCPTSPIFPEVASVGEAGDVMRTAAEAPNDERTSGLRWPPAR